MAVCALAQGEDTMMSSDGTNVKGKAAIEAFLGAKVWPPLHPH
ncbi:MAG: hypothetical protein P4L40_26755 [Terracidiphilus sp.]|nr:hypothetical protein [Terracidiphilus sp.]